MENTYHIPFTPVLGQISREIHDYILTLLKHRNPAAELFCEDPELEQLYYAWILIRDGMFKLSEQEREGHTYILFEMEL